MARHSREAPDKGYTRLRPTEAVGKRPGRLEQAPALVVTITASAEF